ncbi:MAG TPA: GAF domain-containing protein [Verrucomicrobiae bacterium]|nr:GAF domain-containing protein [Verrucomicrobiae bacterium]
MNIEFETSTSCLSPSLHSSLLDLLDAAIQVDGAAKGNVQLLNPFSGALEICAQRGFSQDFLQLFQNVRVDEPSACGRALKHRNRVMIPDITRDAPYQSYISIAQSSGYRAVQSTPIIGADGNPIGVYSTHFSNVHRLSANAETALDSLAFQMAWVITENTAHPAGRG